RTPGDRPSLTGDTPADEISKILAAREPVYLQLAQITIDCGDDDATPATIALHLAELLRSGYVIGSHLTIQQLQPEQRGSSPWCRLVTMVLTHATAVCLLVYRAPTVRPTRR